MLNELTIQKTIPFLLFMLLLTICLNGFSQDNIAKYGTINIIYPQSEGEEIIISRISNDLLGYEYDTLTIDEGSEISIKLEMIRPQMLKITSEKLRYWRDVYLVPEKKVIIHIEPDKKDIAFGGDLTNENNYLISSYRDPRIKAEHWAVVEEPSRSKLYGKLDRYFKTKKEILDEYFPDEASRQQPFYKIRLTEQEAFKHYARLNYYDIYYSGREPLKYDQFIIENVDLNFLKDGNDSLKMESYYFRNLFVEYLKHYFILQEYGPNWREQLETIGYSAMHLHIINKFYPKLIRDFTSYDMLHLLVENDPAGYAKKYPSIPSLLEKYGSKIGDKSLARLEKIYEENMRISMAYAPGSPMPEFLLKKVNGEMLNTSQPQGKPVLYDVWASWCGPCLRNFPNVLEVEQKYQDKLEVISLSLDKKEEDHLKMLKKIDVPGKKHLWVENEFKSDFANFFQMESLPAYLLVSADGKIIKFGSWSDMTAGIEGLNFD